MIKSWRPDDWPEIKRRVLMALPSRADMFPALTDVLMEDTADAMLAMVLKLIDELGEVKDEGELFCYAGPAECEYACLHGLKAILTLEATKAQDGVYRWVEKCFRSKGEQ